MRYTSIVALTVANAATAIVIPDEQMAKGLAADAEDYHQQRQGLETLNNWWNDVQLNDAEDAFDAISEVTHQFLNNPPSVDDVLGSLFDTDTTGDYINAEDFFNTDKPKHRPGHGKHPKHPGHGHVGKPGHHGTTNLTVYQSIKASNFTTRFAKLIDEYPDLVEKLNSTKSNVTAFVPIDKAFEKIPEHDKPSKEYIESLMKYHILEDSYPAGRVLSHHTLPTALNSKALGDRPQRVRVSLSLFGLRLNFYSKVVMANLFTSNGVAHGIDSLLVPPTTAERLVGLFPGRFSTLELAAAKTGLTNENHEHRGKDSLTGLTIFAPTNFAFRKLGPRANAFLFNTERGLGYLRALLKYHIVVNETLYSDEYYGAQEEDKSSSSGKNGHFHVDLPTLLGKNLSIDIARLYGHINMRINGYTNVAIEDGVAEDGVVHVLNSILIPPREGKKSDGVEEEEEGEDGYISVEDLVERLQPYVVEEDDMWEMAIEKMKDAGEMLGHGAQTLKEQVWGEL
ncbi:FAS1 domain-containing protein [Xylariaceae sp. FL0255]|nr:FAS1 domain-containing protein [Xylariaceae sp. FL0255]